MRSPARELEHTLAISLPAPTRVCGIDGDFISLIRRQLLRAPAPLESLGAGAWRQRILSATPEHAIWRNRNGLVRLTPSPVSRLTHIGNRTSNSAHCATHSDCL